MDEAQVKSWAKNMADYRPAHAARLKLIKYNT